MDTILHLGLHVVGAIQSIGSFLLGPMLFFTSLGYAQFYQLLIPAIYWCVDSAVGIRLAVLLVVSSEVNTWGKWLCHGPRPYWLDASLHRVDTGGYGLPSGHAQDAVAAWFYLASQVRRRWAWIAAAALVLLISLSRLYLGVHFPHDVLVGWLLGGLCLGAFLWLAPRAGRYVSRLPLAGVALVSAATAGAILLIGHGVLAVMADVPDPPAWAVYAMHARDFSHSVDAASMLAGAILGYVLQERYVRFDTAGPLGQRLLRFLVGFIGLSAIIYGAGGLAHAVPVSYATEERVILAVRFCRYFLAMLWAAYLAPWVFVRLRLASPRPPSV